MTDRSRVHGKAEPNPRFITDAQVRRALEAAKRGDEQEVRKIMREWVAKIHARDPNLASSEVELEIAVTIAVMAIKDEPK